MVRVWIPDVRVLLIASVYPRNQLDGEVPWLREAVRRLVASGVEVDVLAPSWKGLLSHKIDGVKVHRFRYAPPPLEILTHDEGAPSKIRNNRFLQLLAIPYILSGSLAAFYLTLLRRPDVLHVHWPFPHGIMALLPGLIPGVRTVLNFHGASLLLARTRPWLRPVLRFLIGRADRVFCNSSFTESRVCELRQISVHISPYGSTVGALKELRPCRKPEAPFRLLFVGRHVERKGLNILLEAMEKLPKSKGWSLTIVGEGDQTPMLKKRAAEISQAEILFVGKVGTEELRDYYRDADAFVLPAIVDSTGDTEGLGVVLVEAIRYGLPLIASNVGGIVDVLLHEQTGLLVPEKDSGALVLAAENLRANPELCEKLTTQAQKHAERIFDWDRITAETLEEYSALFS